MITVKTSAPKILGPRDRLVRDITVGTLFWARLSRADKISRLYFCTYDGVVEMLNARNTYDSETSFYEIIELDAVITITERP